MVKNDNLTVIGGYSVYRFNIDLIIKGGGVAICVKAWFCTSLSKSITTARQFELIFTLLAVIKEAISSLSDVLQSRSDSELIILDGLNWDWPSSASDCLKESLNLTQFINIPTRLNSKDLSKSALLDLILTNVPCKYSSTPVFRNDVSDHCAIACVR